MNNEKKNFLIGSIRLTDLIGELCQKNGMDGLFIPFNMNPSISVRQDSRTGQAVVELDLLIRENHSEKTGSTHFVKLNVGKMNRERFALSQEVVNNQKIIGNLWTKTPAPKMQAQQMPYQAPQQPLPHQYQPQRAYPPQAQQGGFAPLQQDGLPAGW